MQYSFKFLQTGGVPLTNDLMALIEEAYGIFESLGGLAGNQTIVSGCSIIGGSIEPGIVAIDGNLYYFEGGTIGNEVCINTEQIYKTFQDQTDKVLIEKKTVKFGLGSPQYYWSDFIRLKTIKEIQMIALAAATQAQVTDLSIRIQELELLTAPIKTKRIRWFFQGDIADIPAGWEIDNNMEGLVTIGVDPTDNHFDESGKKWGFKTHQLTESEMPAHSHNMPNQVIIQSAGKANSDAYHRVQSNYVNRNTDSKGGNQPHNNIQPSIAGYWLKPI